MKRARILQNIFIGLFILWLIPTASTVLDIVKTTSNFHLALSLNPQNISALTVISILEVLLFLSWALAEYWAKNHSLRELLQTCYDLIKSAVIQIIELIIGLYITVTLFTVQTPVLAAKIVLISIGVAALIFLEFIRDPKNL